MPPIPTCSIGSNIVLLRRMPIYERKFVERVGDAHVGFDTGSDGLLPALAYHVGRCFVIDLRFSQGECIGEDRRRWARERSRTQEADTILEIIPMIGWPGEEEGEGGRRKDVLDYRKNTYDQRIGKKSTNERS